VIAVIAGFRPQAVGGPSQAMAGEYTDRDSHGQPTFYHLTPKVLVRF
jgi:hypothetical protein